MSRWMVRQGARNLAYVSRSGADAAGATVLMQELEHYGVHAVVIKCDVCDKQQLTNAVAEMKKTLPPIRGVFQAAMVLQDSLFLNMSHESFLAAIGPKVAGSWNLHEATLDCPLDFFVMLSSLAGLMGTAGQANYVAGCNYQVALAAHRRSMHLPAASIDIGYVSGVGFIAENATAAIEQNLTKIGMGDIKEVELHAMLEIAIRDPRLAEEAQGHLITGIYAADATRTPADDLPFFARNSVFSHMEVLRPYLHHAGLGDGEASEAGRKPLQSSLNSSTSINDAQEVVLEALQHKAARLLMMPTEDLDTSLSLGAYGVDSLVAIEIRNWVLREARADVSIFDVLNAPSLRSLAETVMTKSRLVHAETTESS